MNQVHVPLPPLGNRFAEALPGDPDTTNRPRQVQGACWSPVRPRGFPDARLLAWSREVGEALGFSPDTVGEGQFTAYMSGSALLPGLEPYAQCYGGHQFGHWAGQLGDGRAINLGEITDRHGQHQILQLKGAGPTPYSRTADGLAVLRSSLREFVCSEAMHHLGVPTTRALSLVLSGESVLRDMFYDGRPELEPGAIVCRVAPSFLRFGSFEIFSAQQDHKTLRQLADFCISRDFPHLWDTHSSRDTHLSQPGDTHSGTPELYARWFEEVCQRTATLLVHWMRVGFVHGVMNTDNMSILGLTIDYGPYGWVENYDPNWTPNTTDAQGRRYRFGAQPQVALWNLVQLANAIYPLVEAVEPLETALEGYKASYEGQWLAMMRRKCGLTKEDADDSALMQQLLGAFHEVETDMTLFFRALATLDPRETLQQVPESIRDTWYDATPGEQAEAVQLAWLRRWQSRVQAEGSDAGERLALMQATNPLYVPRNWLLQLAIDAIEEDGDTSRLEELLRAFRHPYTEREGLGHLARKRPDWARQRPGCSMLSCSS